MKGIFMWRISGTAVAIACLWLMGAGPADCSVAWAQSFRMETDVFVGAGREPAVQYLTLFTADAVYDFRLSEPEEITLVDVKRNRLVLLDPTRKMKSTLSTDDVLQFSAALKTQLVTASDPIFNFATNPSFETSFDEQTEWLTLSSKQLTYRVKGSRPKLAEAVGRYHEFADWSARLNTMRPGNLPPFARIAANKAIADRGWLPEEVERVVVPTKFGQRKLEMKTRHLVNWILSETDKKRIDRVGDLLATLPETSIHVYRADSPAERQAKR